MKNYELTKKIPARKKAEIMNKARQAHDKKEIFDMCKTAGIFYGNKFGWNVEETKTVILSLYACGLCVFNMEHSDTIFDYLVSYITWKMRIFEKLNDYGAFGDSIEMVVHLVAMRKMWRTNKKHLHVSVIGNTDVIINGIRFEVGHNGKTWGESTIDNPMKGPFEGVIYGVFSPDETELIISLFKCGKVMEGISNICNQLYVFPDKYAHYNFMNSISRSNSIIWKENIQKYMTRYNDSKYSAFIEKVEKSDFVTLSEYMKSLSDNDWIV